MFGRATITLGISHILVSFSFFTKDSALDSLSLHLSHSDTYNTSNEYVFNS